MRSGPFRLLLLTPLAAITLAASGGAPTRAQDTPSWNKNVPKPTPAPAKPRPRTPPRQTPRRAPEPTPQPFWAQYRVIKINDDNSQVEVNPVTVFNRGDRLRFAVKSNQDAYLYVIHQKSPNDSGRVYIPDSRINNGQNFLARDREFVVPSGCPPGADPHGCTHAVDGSGGPEYFTIIFSRRPTPSLLETSAGADGGLSPQKLTDYVNANGQRLDTSVRGDSIFARRARITRAGDEIVMRFVLTKRG